MSPRLTPTGIAINLTFREAREVYDQLGDLPKCKMGPWLLRLYEELEIKLALAGQEFAPVSQLHPANGAEALAIAGGTSAQICPNVPTEEVLRPKRKHTRKSLP